jgi:hypothetical protein
VVVQVPLAQQTTLHQHFKAAQVETVRAIHIQVQPLLMQAAVVVAVIIANLLQRMALVVLAAVAQVIILAMVSLER